MSEPRPMRGRGGPRTGCVMGAARGKRRRAPSARKLRLRQAAMQPPAAPFMLRCNALQSSLISARVNESVCPACLCYVHNWGRQGRAGGRGPGLGPGIDSSTLPPMPALRAPLRRRAGLWAQSRVNLNGARGRGSESRVASPSRQPARPCTPRCDRAIMMLLRHSSASIFPQISVIVMIHCHDSLS